MKYCLTIGLVMVMACFALTDCYAEALSMSSNGHRWNTAGFTEKRDLVKTRTNQYPSKVLSDYNFWIRNLDKFYDTKDPESLRTPISEVWGIIILAHDRNEKARHKFGD